MLAQPLWLYFMLSTVMSSGVFKLCWAERVLDLARATRDRAR